PRRREPRALRSDAPAPRAVVASLAALALACRPPAHLGPDPAMIDAALQAFALAVAAAFGAIIGSFLNVCIYRLPLDRSLVWPSSACPLCARELSWYENIPVVSYLALRARCRTCGGRISVRYPSVESLAAAMFALAWWYYGPGPLLVSRLVFGCALIVLFAIDLEHH